MTARYLIDTDICIFLRKNTRPQLLQRFSALAQGEAVMSVVTLGELRVWIEKHLNRTQAERLVEGLQAGIEVLPLPLAAAAHYGAIRAGLERAGEVIGANDLWIAAHAKAAKLTLITNNEREFKRVPGLKVQNWAID